MTLGRYMKENKIRTKKLAELTGIDAGYLGQVRAGNRRPGPDNAKKIADAIGINVLNLLYPQDAERQQTDSEVSV